MCKEKEGNIWLGKNWDKGGRKRTSKRKEIEKQMKKKQQSKTVWRQDLFSTVIKTCGTNLWKGRVFRDFSNFKYFLGQVLVL